MNLQLFNPTLFCSFFKLTESTFLQKLTESTISGLLTMLGIAFAAWLAYLYALKQKRKEIFVGLEQTKYQRKLHALESCWKLLAYTTDTENARAVLLWSKEKGKDKEYAIVIKNAKEFLKELPEYFYQTGLGIYLSKEIKEKLFEYRSILYGVILSQKESEELSLKVKNNEMAKKMIHLHKSLILLIKSETDTIDKIEMRK